MAFRVVIKPQQYHSLSPRAGIEQLAPPVKIPVSKYPFLNVPFFVRARKPLEVSYSSSALPGRFEVVHPIDNTNVAV